MEIHDAELARSLQEEEYSRRLSKSDSVTRGRSLLSNLSSYRTISPRRRPIWDPRRSDKRRITRNTLWDPTSTEAHMRSSQVVSLEPRVYGNRYVFMYFYQQWLDEAYAALERYEEGTWGEARKFLALWVRGDQALEFVGYALPRIGERAKDILQSHGYEVSNSKWQAYHGPAYLQSHKKKQSKQAKRPCKRQRLMNHHLEVNNRAGETSNEDDDEEENRNGTCMDNPEDLMDVTELVDEIARITLDWKNKMNWASYASQEPRMSVDASGRLYWEV